MELTKIHKFTTKQLAIDAIKKINSGEGIPVSKSAITATYCELQSFKDWFYIVVDSVTMKYIKDIVEFKFPEL